MSAKAAGLDFVGCSTCPNAAARHRKSPPVLALLLHRCFQGMLKPSLDLASFRRKTGSAICVCVVRSYSEGQAWVKRSGGGL